MTLPRTETPLRRSAVGNQTLRESMLHEMTITPVANDDEAERREARRRTLVQQQMRTRESTALGSIEEDETIKKCLDIYNGNKLSRDNAWNLSLIDTLSSLLDRHHQSLSNFKIAGSSLEASSKVYGLRVDSIYLDVMRMSAGLNSRVVTEQQLNEAADREDNAPDNNEGGQPAEGAEAVTQAAPAKKKRTRKAVSTVTKNPETINAQPDTAPLQDPVFGKLNSTVGSINASNRLMNNVLPTLQSELRLCTSYRFWTDSELPAQITDFTQVNAEQQQQSDEEQPLVSADWVAKLRRYESQLKLRPLHTGYIITDTPNPTNASTTQPIQDDDAGVDNGDADFYENPKELSMAFDINAECEPMPELDMPSATVMEVDYQELEELTTEERTTLNHCRPLRKPAVQVNDLRPVDGNSKLDYSYRPLEQISQFWAGPTHWKFKRQRATRTTLGQSNLQDNNAGAAAGAAATRARRAAQQAAKRRNQQLNFGVYADNMFQQESKTKLRKANFQKRWDPRKLVLPTRYEFEENYFYRYDFAPSIKVSRNFGQPDDEIMDVDTHSTQENEGDDVELYDNDHFTEDAPIIPDALGMEMSGFPASNSLIDDGLEMGGDTMLNNETVLEIATDFDGAPSQVTKVVVPFAKRAKVIDMKNLKRSCNCLIQKQLLNNVIEEEIPQHPRPKEEHYTKGMASFTDIYDALPSIITGKMADSLSTSVALYAVLHLANDMQLRLISQNDLENFIIRQVTDD
ncbi:condensin complex subunit 2 [Drosophila busckii]|uniref:condensin complex subunit 2 n=1 Tax=Drosophila busckii TaxID=30019 RepID=UPI0014332450|nr:condensin complex subunit 2 [Drosophila busckii]